MGSEPEQCVLLVQCHAADVRLISKALTGEAAGGLRVECVDNVAAALARIGTGGVQGIILDIEMPGNRGLVAYETLFSAAPQIPILILSGNENESVANQAVERGSQDYILKSHLQESSVRRAVRRMIERNALEELAYRQLQCAEATLACSDEAVLTSDDSERVTYLNPAAELLTGWSREEAQGRPLGEVFRVIGTITPGLTVDQRSAKATVEKNDPLAFDCILIRRDGPEVAIHNSTTPTRDRSGNVTGALAIFHDLGIAREKILELSHLAQHDFLTGLPNRLLLNDRTTQAISFAARYSTQLAVMFVDLDHFKSINDTSGHAVGDKLLQVVAGRIVACVRRSDTVSRHGGDEFVVLLSQVEHAEDAVFIARKILRSLAEPYLIDQKQLLTNASIGVSTYPGDGQDAETLIHRADTAMYEAKKLGRNNYQFFKADMQARVLEWQSLEGNLRGALDRNEFTLHYQPKIELKTGRVTGVEALIRWKHPERGLIQPNAFVPIAEESGLIVPIGQWVLLEALRQARVWLDAGLPPVRIAVNVSALEFMAKDFLSGVRAALISTGVQPQNLELELTETVLMRDAESAVETLHALKAIGVQLAVDDFGTGYSSFSYLRRFPLDSLKVDRSFINEISSGGNDRTILSAMINIGRSLNHRVVAEGVETREQLHFLQQQQCSEGQGFFFCHPVIADKFAEFLETGARESVVH